MSEYDYTLKYETKMECGAVVKVYMRDYNYDDIPSVKFTISDPCMFINTKEYAPDDAIAEEESVNWARGESRWACIYADNIDDVAKMLTNIVYELKYQRRVLYVEEDDRV